MLRIGPLSCFTFLAILGLPILTVYPMPSPTRDYSLGSWRNNASSGLAQDQKAQLYTRWYDLTSGGPEQQNAAYEIGQEFLRKFGSFDDQQVQTVRKWMAKYERAALEFAFNQAAGSKDYVKTFELGRKMLSEDPDNFRVLSLLTVAATLIGQQSEPNMKREATDFARRAVQLLEAGKVTAADPFSSTDEAAGFLNFSLGQFLIATSPAEAARALRKAAQTKSAYGQDAATYVLLAGAIAASEFNPLQAEYKKKYEGKLMTPEAAALYKRLSLIIDRLIDAYARAVALSTKPEQQQSKNLLLAELTKIYKSIHNDSDTGLNDLIASVLSKPLP